MATTNAPNSQERSQDHNDRDQITAQAHPAKELPVSEERGARLARELRGFGPLGMVAIIAILLTALVGSNPLLPLSAILVLIWARWSNTPWRDIGYARPKSWSASIVIGIAFGVAFKFLMKAVVMPLL